MPHNHHRPLYTLLAAGLVSGLAGCADTPPLPTALGSPEARSSMEPVLGELGDVVITSSAFAGAHPAREGHNLLALAQLPDGRLAGVVLHVGRGCEGDPYLADPAGAIALIERGDCLFREKALRAQAAGALGIIVYNQQGVDFLGGWSVGDPPITLPGVLVHRETGLLLRDGEAPVTALVRPAFVENLEDAVQTLADAGLLSHGQLTSLLKKLELAERHIERGNEQGAIGVLKAFVDQVEGLVADGIIAAEDGAMLIAAAAALIASLKT
jgi:hypothetical protein